MVAMFSCFKKSEKNLFSTRGLFISRKIEVRSHRVNREK